MRSIELRRKRLTRVSLGSVYSESKSGERGGEREIPKKFTKNVRRMPRKEDSLTFGTLGWRALPLDYDRSGSIPLSFSKSGGSCWDGAFLSMSYPFIRRILVQRHVSSCLIFPSTLGFA